MAAHQDVKNLTQTAKQSRSFANEVGHNLALMEACANEAVSNAKVAAEHVVLRHKLCRVHRSMPKQQPAKGTRSCKCCSSIRYGGIRGSKESFRSDESIDRK